MSKRRKKKNSKGAIIISIIIIIALIIGVAFVLSGSKDKPLIPDDTTIPEISTTIGDSKEEDSTVNETEDDTTLPEDSTEEETEGKTNYPSKAPVETPDEDLTDMSDIIVTHYENYMGVKKGVLFINKSENVERNGQYEFILRSNAKSPNQYVADVYVDKKTGIVTDSMESESWEINLWY